MNRRTTRDDLRTLEHMLADGLSRAEGTLQQAYYHAALADVERAITARDDATRNAPRVWGS